MKKTESALYTVFLYGFLTLTLLSFNPFVYYLAPMRPLVYSVAALGLVCCTLRLFSGRRYFNASYAWLAILFLISYALTALLNRRFGILESMQGFLWLAFQLLLLYPRDATEKKVAMLRQLRGILLYFVFYNALVSLAGIFMVASGYGEVYRLSDTQLVPRGFVWGRLWGMYSDPNYGSASAAVSFALSLHFFLRARRAGERLIFALSMLVLYLYIVFSDSRTGMVALASCLLVYAFCRFYGRLGQKGKRALFPWKRALYASFLALFISLIAVGGVQVTKTAYNGLVAILYPPQAGQEKPTEDKQIDRDYEDESDLSNGRLALWKSGTELFYKAPLFGVGFRNFRQAAGELAPGTYLIHNPQGASFDAFHNVFVDALAAQGLIGLLLFSAFAALGAVSVFRLLARAARYGRRTFELVSVLAAALAAVLAESLFISDLLYVNTPTAFLFWYVFGCLMRVGADLSGGANLPSRLDEWEKAIGVRGREKA